MKQTHAATAILHSGLSNQANASPRYLSVECPGKETVLYFKLTAKQIGAELLTRVISVCPWMPASHRGRMPQSVCQCALDVSLLA